MNTALDRAAVDVLLANWTGAYTVPSRALYPHQWSWDSAFVAIGLRHVSARRAQRELESLFGAQWADGRVPHIVFDPAAAPEGYFPGPDFWRSTDHPASPAIATSGLVQPPVHALAAWLTFRADPAQARRRGFLPRLYPRLVAWHRYLATRRGVDDLVAIVHPWESGMDNSPAWDAALCRVEPTPAHGFRRRDLLHVQAAERPTDTDYGRYVRLAGDYRDSGYADRLADAQFVLLDPMVNALYAASESALADIAAEIGADPRPHREAAERTGAALVARLFADGFCHAYDVHERRLDRQRTVAGLTPLVVADLPVAPALVKSALGDHFRLGRTALPPSYDLTGPAFDPDRYWRGPGWFNTTWLVWHGLTRHGELDHAGRLRDATLTAARQAGFREYLHPLTGEGRGATDFSWTAAVVLDLLRTAP
ncbi:MGH1-like glycoside hydrolase domain-containing protein [Micromonospora echinospora]